MFFSPWVLNPRIQRNLLFFFQPAHLCFNPRYGSPLYSKCYTWTNQSESKLAFQLVLLLIIVSFFSPHDPLIWLLFRFQQHIPIWWGICLFLVIITFIWWIIIAFCFITAIFVIINNNLDRERCLWSRWAVLQWKECLWYKSTRYRRIIIIITHYLLYWWRFGSDGNIEYVFVVSPSHIYLSH